MPNVGQQILIAPEVCEPDNETCILPRQNVTRTCIYGGPRLYYTVNGDTYEIVARRLNITVDSLMAYAKSGETATTLLEVDQFLKVPQCSPSQCGIQPYSFMFGVYKDLAEEYGTTMGQIMMMSPRYNYSSIAMMGGTPPPIGLPINCTALSNNVTVLN
ncbi:Peptidoglycan-binding Lysin subgroup [Botryosphaeria dothidea]|uniref:Peptidoglycan-binding Lysin subgroup n=1 Tax=Botryosphaeria dothidea TaxID=55169 RepID=A0A8H4IV09_9PEZI|nr:Peptidoglycan-binding Lysin subgroup [Botryosphaeria dothidea]